jgi:hypothetical protein
VRWSVRIAAIVCRSSGRTILKVDGELDRCGAGAEEARRAEVREHASHGSVVGQHQSGELGDAFLSGAIGQPMQQRLADPASLPGLEDGDCDLRAASSLVIADVAGDSDALVAIWIDRQQRLVVPAIDLGQILELGPVTFDGHEQSPVIDARITDAHSIG